MMTSDLKRFALDLVSRAALRRMGVRPMGWTLRPEARVFEDRDVIYQGVIIRHE